MNRSSQTFFIVFLFFPLFSLIAQPGGVPFLRNYFPREYKSSLQNWAVVQDKRGVMFFGNNQGVLEYDGVNWRLIPVSNGSIVRSLAVDEAGKVYVGAVDQFGYLQPDASGTLQYVSLSDQLPREERKFFDVRGAIVKGNEVYFHSMYRMFRVRDGKIKIWKLSNSYHCNFLVNNRIYLRQDGKGLMVLEGDSLVQVKGGEIFTKEWISAMLPYSRTQILIGCRYKGLFLYDTEKQTIAPLESPASEFLKESTIYTGAYFKPHGTFLIGSLRKGLIEFDKQGKIVSWCNKSTGLQSNIVYSLAVDNQDILWMALGSGVSRLELSSPFRVWNRFHGLEGDILSVTRFQGKICVGTHEGFFVMQPDGKFKLLDGEGTGQTWQFCHARVGNQLIVATTLGFLSFDGQKLNLIKQTRVGSILAPASRPDHLYAGSNGTLFTFRYQNNQWKEGKSYKLLNDEFRTLAEDSEGNVWFGTLYSGVLKVSKDFIKADSLSMDSPLISRYDTTAQLPSMNWNHIYNIDNQITVATQKGIYRFDAQAKNFVKDKAIEDAFRRANSEGSAERWIFALSQDAEGNIWFDSDKGKGVLLKKNNGYELLDTPFRRIAPSPENQVGMYAAGEGIGWFSTPEGLVRYHAENGKSYNSVFNTMIRRIRIGEDSVLFNGAPFANPKGKSASKPVISYTYNSIAFDYAASTYEDESTNEYSYILEGYEKHWSPWGKETYKEYTNLWEGTYTFKVKTRNHYGTESSEAIYAFKIRPPWYRTVGAYAVYLLVGSVLIWLLLRFNSKRLEKRNKLLEQIVTERTAEIMKQRDDILEKNAELAQKQEEIEAQRDDILTKNAELGQAYEEITIQKNQTETLYNNIIVLSEIGQKITSVLSLEALLRTVYQNVNAMMPATALGIGVYNEVAQNIDFHGFMEKGEQLPFFSHQLSDENRFSVWTFKNQKEIFINNIEEEYHHYIQKIAKVMQGEETWSLIYLPLFSENQPIGVLTVQSFEKYAYSEQHLTILRTLGAYISVAINNARNFEHLAEAKSLIERKNTHITDSIRYAETIQQSILPGHEMLDQALGQDNYFVFFKPKDIVSGDFYWCRHFEDKTYIAVVDCTGHGVPGAFMSLIGNTLLNDIVSQYDGLSPAVILEKLHYHIRTSLRQESNVNDDGMDVSLCLIEKPEAAPEYKKVTFAGAKRPLFHLHGGGIEEIRGDKKSIGGRQKEEKRTFTNQVIELQGNDMLYLCSDGYADQIGQNHEKYGSQRLKELLRSHAHLPLPLQKQLLKDTLLQHQGQTEQRDDITLIGIRL